MGVSRALFELLALTSIVGCQQPTRAESKPREEDDWSRNIAIGVVHRAIRDAVDSWPADESMADLTATLQHWIDRIEKAKAA